MCLTTHFVCDMKQSVLRVISDKAIISNRNRTEATNVRWSSLPIEPAVTLKTRQESANKKIFCEKHTLQKVQAYTHTRVINVRWSSLPAVALKTRQGEPIKKYFVKTILC